MLRWFGIGRRSSAPAPQPYPYPYPYPPQAYPQPYPYPVANEAQAAMPPAQAVTPQTPVTSPETPAPHMPTGPQPAPATGPQPAPATGPQPAPATGPQPAPATGPQPPPPVAEAAPAGSSTVKATKPASAERRTNGAAQDLTTAALASLAMRDLTLVESMLDIVEELEETTEDSDLLDKLFKIDNLATRMRRNGENLLVLADQESSDSRMEPIPLLDVARAAISEIKDYDRVQVGRLPEKAIVGSAADDISHLLAELLDNATAKSPEHAQVVVTGQPMADGKFLLSVEDEGIGVPAEQLTELNERLRGNTQLGESVMRHMGLYVVSRIAHRHGLEVQLEARAFRGISAFVVIPPELVRDPVPEAPSVEQPMRVPAPSRQPVAAAAVASSTPPQPSTPNGPRQSGGSTSAVTAAGLPRRSARTTSPLTSLPPPGQGSGTTDTSAPRQEPSPNRAERIRDDLDSFLAGERAATNEDGEQEDS